MKGLNVLLAFALAGCFPKLAEVMQRPYSQWSDRDGLIVAASIAKTNAADIDNNLIVTVIPLTPDVVMAFSKMDNRWKMWTPAESRRNLDALLKDGSGLYIDSAGALWTGKARPYRGPADLDSLLVIIRLANRTYPCASPTVGGVPLMPLQDVPCDLLDISGIEGQIVLLNERGVAKSPSYVEGRKGGILYHEEWLFARFRFEQGFIGTGELTLSINAGQKPVHFTIALR